MSKLADWITIATCVVSLAIWLIRRRQAARRGLRKAAHRWGSKDKPEIYKFPSDEP